MAITVKLADAEEKSTQQMEQDVIDQVSNTSTEAVSEPEGLTDEQVLEHIKSKYEGRELSSLDDIFLEKETESYPEVPEGVQKFIKFQEETGRGFEDFVELNKDYNSLPDDAVIEKYLIATEEGLDKSDVQYMLRKYDYDEDIDDESEVAEKKLDKKRMVSQAKKYLSELQEKYKTPIEDFTSSPGIDADELKSFQEQKSKAKAESEENARRSEWFEQKTNELFSNNFEGFKAKVGDYDISFKFGNSEEMKKANSTPWNFVSKYLDDKGFLKDPEGYHKSLAVAQNWEQFAQMMIEHGKALAVEDIDRQGKNINMSPRPRPQSSGQSGLSVRAVESDRFDDGLRVKSGKKN